MKSLHLLYHELRSSRSDYSYVVSSDLFQAHCGLFAEIKAQGQTRFLEPAITFDDGNLSDYTLAAPILEGYGLVAAFFVTAGWTGRRAGFLDWPQLRSLHAAGHTIGAHGMSHKLLTQCSAAELQEELQGARKRLEDGLGSAVTCMSLPGGRANGHVFRACAEAGFLQVFTSSPKPVEIGTSPKLVGRLNLVGSTSVPWLERVLDTHTGQLARLEQTARLKHAAKRLLGDRLYARLWAVVNRQEADASEPEVRPL